MIHHRQCLPLRLEPGDHLLGVHAQLDDLQRHAPPNRLGLFGHIDHPAPAFAHPFQQLVVSERLTHGFVGRFFGEIELNRRAGRFGLCGEQRFGLLMRGK